MSYSRRVDRLNPGCLIFLIDQSESMGEQIAHGAGLSKAAAVASALNDVLYELVLRCVKTPWEPPRPYFSVATVGYCTNEDGEAELTSVLPPSLTAKHFVTTAELAANPLRIERRGPRASVSVPVWVGQRSLGGTPMCAALNRAGQLASHWLKDHPDAIPPIVVNLTDGESTDGSPAKLAARLRSLESSDGHLLLFNLSLSAEEAGTALFPNTDRGLPGEYAKSLYELSSELPSVMVDMARTQGLRIDPGARGFGFNADFRSLVMFLNVGTAIGRSLR